MTYQVNCQNMITFSGTEGFKQYQDFRAFCGEPPELKLNSEFVYQGFHIRYLPSL